MIFTTAKEIISTLPFPFSLDLYTFEFWNGSEWEVIGSGFSAGLETISAISQKTNNEITLLPDAPMCIKISSGAVSSPTQIDCRQRRTE